jgi:hypothetical protein
MTISDVPSIDDLRCRSVHVLSKVESKLQEVRLELEAIERMIQAIGEKERHIREIEALIMSFDGHGEWTDEVKQSKLREASAGLEAASLDKLIAQSRTLKEGSSAMSGRIHALSTRLKAIRQRLDAMFRELDSKRVLRRDEIEARGNEASKLVVRFSEVATREISALNPRGNQDVVARALASVQRRAKDGFQFKNLPEKLHGNPADMQREVFRQMVPNLAVREAVVRAPPPTLENVEETKRRVSDMNFTFSDRDPNFVVHVLDAIAKDCGLNLVLVPEPSADVVRDSCNKGSDFAMENDMVMESNLCLLGSTCPEHERKGITLRLGVSYDEIMENKATKDQFIAETTEKLAWVHGVAPNDIVILSLTKGSVTPTYAVGAAALNANNTSQANDAFTKAFGSQYLGHEVHPAFQGLQINPRSFDPQWNRDYRVPGNCPQGEKRGSLPYYAPAGFIRFGLNVKGRRDNGNDTWLGMSNVPGEWAVFYHGTKRDSVAAITENPLHPGSCNVYGKGIYCTPNISVASGYATGISVKTHSGPKTYQYVFMCRANPRRICNCTTSPCPNASNPAYTLHKTTCTDYWFVNGDNNNYEHIRPYGLLVRES